MKVEKVRIQNFRCISDSGELALDEHLTILVGTNECGKTAILEALKCFNRGENFDEADVSTLTVYDKLFSIDFDRASVPMVTVCVQLEPAELAQLGIAYTSTEPRVEITKRLDNTYEIRPLFPMPELLSLAGAGEERGKFKAVLEEIRKQLRDVYQGRVKNMRYDFSYVFLEAEENEPQSYNLILFAESAPHIWGQLKTGDWVQVTKTASDLYGRNTKALNAGLRVDIERIAIAISQIVNSMNSSDPIKAASVKDLGDTLESIPKGHPILDYFTPEFVEYVKALQAQQPVTWLPKFSTQVENNLPDFVYVTDTTTVVDDIPIREYGVENLDTPRASNNLVEALGSLAGLAPTVFHPGASSANRLFMLEQASIAITRRYKELWPGIEIRFWESGQKLALGIVADGRAHPPTKRSAGLRSFLALLANVFSVGVRGNAVLLLDDPGVHLHPKIQRDIAKFLANGSFPVVIATHLPYLIDTDILDGIRVVLNPDGKGPRVVPNWQEAGGALQAVFGSLSMRFSNSRVLVVEGKHDWIAYRRGSDICKASSKTHLPNDLPVIQGGGADNVVWTVSALKSAGAHPLVLLDGDTKGRTRQRDIRNISGIKQQAVFTLHDVFGEDYVLEDLFAAAELGKAKDSRAQTVGELTAPTLERLEQLFSYIVHVHNTL